MVICGFLCFYFVYLLDFSEFWKIFQVGEWGTEGSSMTFVVGYSCYSGNKGSESVSNSPKVTPIVSGKARIKA